MLVERPGRERETMGRKGQLTRTLRSVLVSCALCSFGSQHPTNIKVEKKAVYIPSGKGQKPFDVTRHLIGLEDIQSGGPPRDGIPALDHPASTSATHADQILKPKDIVLGVEFGGTAKAYPVRILNWHEVVNDDVGEQPVLISWCPLCGSGVVYDPRVDGQRHSFGVSGRLYKRNLLLYDHETDSLWSQLAGKAVTGPLAGTSLRLLPVTETTWSRWKGEHPATLVLSFQTGFQRDYSRDPYRDWQLDRRLSLVLSYKGVTTIYPYSELKKARPPLKDELAALPITIVFDPKNQVVTVRSSGEEQLPHFVCFFADAKSFFPEAHVFKVR